MTSSNRNTNNLGKLNLLPDWLGGIIVHVSKIVKSKHVESNGHSKVIPMSTSEDPDPQCLRPCCGLHTVVLLSHMGSANG